MNRNNSLGFMLVFLFLCFGRFSFLKAEKIELIKKIEISPGQEKLEMFFLPRDVKTDQRGNVFVLDSGDNCLYKFSEDGELLKKAGRKGPGPGEMDRPLGMDIDSKGNIYLNDPFNRRINIYDNELNFIETIKMDKFYVNLFFFEQRFLMLARPRSPGEKYLHLFSSDGKYLMSYPGQIHPYAALKELDEKERISTALYFFAIANLDQEKSLIGFTHMIPENPMKIYLLNTKGEILKTVKKSIMDYDPKDQFELIKSSFSIKKSYTFKQVVALNFSQTDYMIIQRKDEIYNEGALEKSLFKLDIFSPEGKLVREEMECDGTILHIDQKDNVYLQIEDKEGFFKVGVYSLRIGQ